MLLPMAPYDYKRIAANEWNIRNVCGLISPNRSADDITRVCKRCETALECGAAIDNPTRRKRKTRDRLLKWNNRTEEIILTTEVDNIQESIHTHPVQCYTVGDS